MCYIKSLIFPSKTQQLACMPVVNHVGSPQCTFRRALVAWPPPKHAVHCDSLAADLTPWEDAVWILGGLLALTCISLCEAESLSCVPLEVQALSDDVSVGHGWPLRMGIAIASAGGGSGCRVEALSAWTSGCILCRKGPLHPMGFSPECIPLRYQFLRWQASSRVESDRMCFRDDSTYYYHAASKRYTSTLASFSTACTAATSTSGSLFVQALAALPNHPSSIINSKILPPFVVSTLLSSRTFFFLSLPSCFIASRRISALMAI